MGDLRDLQKNLEQLSQTVDRAGSKLLRASGVAVLQAVIVGTPVGNTTLWNHPDRARAGYVGGRARANWFAAIGAASGEVTQTVDPSGGATIAAGNVVISSADNKSEIHLTNNLPYIVPLNEGHSHQAPAGFIENAVDEGMRAAMAKWGAGGDDIVSGP